MAKISVSREGVTGTVHTLSDDSPDHAREWAYAKALRVLLTTEAQAAANSEILSDYAKANNVKVADIADKKSVTESWRKANGDAYKAMVAKHQDAKFAALIAGTLGRGESADPVEAEVQRLGRAMFIRLIAARGQWDKPADSKARVPADEHIIRFKTGENADGMAKYRSETFGEGLGKFIESTAQIAPFTKIPGLVVGKPHKDETIADFLVRTAEANVAAKATVSESPKVDEAVAF